MKDCGFTEEEVMSLTWGIYGFILLFSAFCPTTVEPPSLPLIPRHEKVLI